MAIRSATSGPSSIQGCNGSNRASTFSVGALNAISAAREERMEDSLGKGKSHNVHHRVFTYDINDSIGTTIGGGFDSTLNMWAITSYSHAKSWFENSNVYIHQDHAWDVASKTSIPPGWTINMPSSETTLKNDVLEKASQLKADGLLNAVEANQIWPAITTLTTSLPKLAANWRDLRPLIRTASGSYLAWKFGVSPILQDMTAVHKFIPKLRNDMDRHRNGDTQRFSVVANVPMGTPSELIYPLGYYGNGNLQSKFSRQGRLLKSAQIRYVLSVKPNVKYMTDFFSKADYFMSRFASSPASLAWEKIPFSFVADWFVDLRGVLRGIDSVIGHSPYEVVSFTRSFSYHCATDCFTDFFSPCNGSAMQSFRSCNLEYKHYERSNVQGGILPQLDVRFGKNQAAITAALISQMLSNIPAVNRFLGKAQGFRY